MAGKEFDLEAYFRLHDVDRSGKWSRQEVVSLAPCPLALPPCLLALPPCHPVPGGRQHHVQPGGDGAGQQLGPHRGGEEGADHGEVDEVHL